MGTAPSEPRSCCCGGPPQGFHYCAGVLFAQWSRRARCHAMPCAHNHVGVRNTRYGANLASHTMFTTAVWPTDRTRRQADSSEVFTLAAKAIDRSQRQSQHDQSHGPIIVVANSIVPSYMHDATSFVAWRTSYISWVRKIPLPLAPPSGLMM